MHNNDSIHLMRRREKLMMVVHYEGYSYQEIGVIFGVTKHQAYKIIQDFKRRYSSADVIKESHVKK